MSTGHVKIGREFFSKIKYDYADWRWALIREFMQNCFDAPKCEKVTVSITVEGRNTKLIVENNGLPMDEDTLHNKLLTLGGSGKNFDGANTGGFGVAKSLLYYTHLDYSIHTGSILVSGSGAEFTASSVGKLDGTCSTITLEGNEVEKLTEMVKRFASMAWWDGTLTLNGEKLTTSLRKGYKRKETKWGVIYTNNSFSNLCLVRLNGQPMFTCYTRYKGCVLVELVGKASEVLTSNRDGLSYKYSSELNDLLTTLAIDKKSALKEQRAEYKRYAGEVQRAEARKPKEAEGGLGTIITPEMAKDLLTMSGGKGAIAGVKMEPTPETAIGGGTGGKLVVLSKEDETDASVSVGPQFILKNATGLKTPVWYTPGEKFSSTSKDLVLAWTATLLKLYNLTGLSGEFSVGFLFDEDTIAEHETGVYGRVYYINPAKLVEEKGKRRLENRYEFVWSDRHDIIASAVHEFVHGAYGHKEHDEDYAGRLTTVMGVAMKHLDEIEPFFHRNKVKTGEVKERVKHADLFGYAVTAVIRWMGREGWNFKEIRRVLNAIDHSAVADKTILSCIFTGKHTDAKVPELTREQIDELEERRW